MDRVTGIVTWYQPYRGYGFIEGSDGKTYYAHHSKITMDGFRKLKKDQKVSFVSVEEERGMAAHDIQLVA